MKDYYAILGIPRQASVGDIKKAYRRLAFIHHPDRNPGEKSRGMMQEINEAYGILGDPSKKRDYDLRYDYRSSPAFQNRSTQRNTRTQPNRTKSAGSEARSGPRANSRRERGTSQKPRPPFRKKTAFNYRDLAVKARFLAGFFFFYTFLLTVDYFIPLAYHHALVRRFVKTSGENTYKVTTDLVDFQVNCHGLSIAPKDLISVEITPIFGIVKELRVDRIDYIYDVRLNTIYSPVYFIVLGVMLTSAMVIRSRDALRACTLCFIAAFGFFIVFILVHLY